MLQIDSTLFCVKNLILLFIGCGMPEMIDIPSLCKSTNVYVTVWRICERVFHESQSSVNSIALWRFVHSAVHRTLQSETDDKLSSPLQASAFGRPPSTSKRLTCGASASFCGSWRREKSRLRSCLRWRSGFELWPRICASSFRPAWASRSRHWLKFARTRAPEKGRSLIR